MRISLSALGLLATLAVSSALPVDSFHEDAALTTTTTKHTTTTTKHTSTATHTSTSTKHTTTATKTSTAAASHSTAPFGREVSLTSQEDFCLFLPPHPGDDVATTETTGVLFCAKGSAEAPGAKTFPSGFITTSHYLKSSTYVQVTGFFDRTKYSLKSSDGGGQYDNHGNGKPTGAQCKGYNYFVNLIEPDVNRFCIRCCQNKVDCNTGRSGYGCLRVVAGDYSVTSTHANTDFNSVLDEVTGYQHLNTIESPTNNTQNSPILAFPNEIVTLETLGGGDRTADEIKSEWSTFISKLEIEYPNNAADIQKLDAVTANINDVAGWDQFLQLLKTKVDAYLYPNEGTDTTGTETTGTDTTGTETTGTATTGTETPGTDSTTETDDHSNGWHEDEEVTEPTSSGDDTTSGDDTDGTTTDTTSDTGSETISDSYSDYVTLEALESELNSKFDTFNSKIVSEIEDLLRNYNPTASVPTDVTPTSDHNNQATW